ncbi:unnamed protein product [Gongylonema pulchrum]|uniref:Uncharacterized protein n=1 Tax=Gongylonema pulchrum TaxID=637853 RepID=A0A3P7MEC8_9BILA|nr:unnamed protein product [Gongylonema pulchrum]
MQNGRGKRTDSDDQLYGEESSRYLTPDRNTTGSDTRYVREPEWNELYYNPYRFMNGAYEREHETAAHHTKTAPKNYGKIIMILGAIVILSTVIFFLIQNYNAMHEGESNREEL